MTTSSFYERLDPITLVTTPSKCQDVRPVAFAAAAAAAAAAAVTVTVVGTNG